MIVTVQEVKDFLKITDTTLDTWFTDLIGKVQADIESYCGRQFESTSHTDEIYSGNGSSRLELKDWPVIQLSLAATPSSADITGSIEYRNDVDSAWQDLETDVDHIITDPDWWYVELVDNFFPIGKFNIRVSYISGYATVPEEVQQVALEKVVMKYKASNKGHGLLGETSRNESGLGFNSSTSLKDMEKEWNRVLDRYRKLV